ncbi:MAG: DUF3300 domain-containing protein [Geobacteraceae bacterium]
MKRILYTLFAALLLLGLAAVGAARAQGDYPESADTAEQSGDTLFTVEELDDLLAPIALYPDPLLAQILPAATFIDQIDEAARFVRQYGKTARIDDQPWDVSVKAMAHYPDVLFMMDQKNDWTVSLGQAFINQQQDVMDAIQRLRAEAQAEGNLVSTPQQEVVDEDNYISIVPAAPELVYVPQYDPLMVYMESSPPYGFITFGIGFAIGAWLDRDCDWHGRRVFYHGWQGRGWISRSRPHIHDPRNIYINNSFSAINVNRKVIQHNTVNFREELRRTAQNRPKQAPLQAARPRDIQPGSKVGNRWEAARPVTTVTRPAERPDNAALYRGREVQGAQPAARSGYGGYGSGKDAATYRERGQSSRANMGQFNRQQQIPAQSQRPAPAQRPATTQGRLPSPGPPAAHPAPRQSLPASRGGGQVRQQR